MVFAIRAFALQLGKMFKAGSVVSVEKPSHGHYCVEVADPEGIEHTVGVDVHEYDLDEDGVVDLVEFSLDVGLHEHLSWEDHVKLVKRIEPVFNRSLMHTVQ